MSNDRILEGLNEAQKNAVVDTEGQLLVLAGAGSGKTRVLTTRVAYLVECLKVNPYNILAITFTNKAAGEMKARILSLIGEDADVWISTFHSMCAQILFRECQHIGFNSNFSIYSDVESARVVKRILRGRDDTGEKENSKLFDTLYGHIKRIKCFNLDIDEYLNTITDSSTSRDVLRVYNAYQQALKESNAMDFDDLLLNTVKLFRECPDVLDKYSNRFRYIHVDEFQDTNSIQYELVKLLASKNQNLFVVGDEDQSIYGWRGAIIQNILNFKKLYPNAKVYRLEENYRSTSYILNAANRVISNNKNRFGKQLFTSKSGGRRVEVFNAYNDREEVDYVVRNINDLVTLTDVKYGDIAILMRANSLSRQFEEALMLYSMPYRVYGGIRFYERREIKDFLAYLRIGLNPKDVDSATRVINYPRRGIGEATIQKMLDFSKQNDLTFFDTVCQIDSLKLFNVGTTKKILDFKAIWLKIIEASSSKTSLEFVEFVLKESGLLDMYKSDEAEIDRLENVKEFVSAVSEFQRDNPNKGIDEFLRMVALISDTDEIVENNNVTLATIHAVKGLEFPVVFVVALEENIFPSSRALDDDDSIEEERRLMYVAITRAKDRLYCSSSRSRFRFNQRQANPRSRFVAEMTGGAPIPSVSAKTETKRSNAQQKPSFASASNVANSFVGINTSAYVAGKKVLHPKFGEGIIVSTSGEGNDKVASISFEGLGIKKFVVAIANMKLV
ncbi:MAG: UvrD-helicase domain-containing protein [Clostridia bacterium]